MFDREYAFTGKHADYVRDLTSNPFSEERKGRGVFHRNIDLYMVAPFVGLLYNKKAIPENSSKNTKIFTDQFTSRDSELNFILFTILLNDREVQDPEDKIINAFKNSYDDNSNTELVQRFNQYLLGGVEVLYEKIVEKSKSYDDIIDNFNSFLEEFNKLYSTPAHLMQSFDKDLIL